MSERAWRFFESKPSVEVVTHPHTNISTVRLMFRCAVPSEWGEFRVAKPSLIAAMVLSESEPTPTSCVAEKVEYWKREKVVVEVYPRRKSMARRDFDRAVMLCLRLTDAAGAVDVPVLDDLWERFENLHQEAFNGNLWPRKRSLWRALRRRERE